MSVHRYDIAYIRILHPSDICVLRMIPENADGAVDIDTYICYVLVIRGLSLITDVCTFLS